MAVRAGLTGWLTDITDDRAPSYLIYGGLVFTALSVPYLAAEFTSRFRLLLCSDWCVRWFF